MEANWGGMPTTPNQRKVPPTGTGGTVRSGRTTGQARRNLSEEEEEIYRASEANRVEPGGSEGKLAQVLAYVDGSGSTRNSAKRRISSISCNS